MGPSNLWLTGAADLAITRLHGLVGNGLIVLALLATALVSTAWVTGALRKAAGPSVAGGVSPSDPFKVHLSTAATSWLPFGAAVGFLMMAGKLGWIGREVLTTLDVVVTGLAAVSIIKSMFAVYDAGSRPLTFGEHVDLPYILPCGFLAFVVGAQYVDVMVIGSNGLVQSLLAGVLWPWAASAVAFLVSVVAAFFAVIFVIAFVTSDLFEGPPEKASTSAEAVSRTTPKPRRRKKSALRKALAYAPPPRWIEFLKRSDVERAMAEWREAQEESERLEEEREAEEERLQAEEREWARRRAAGAQTAPQPKRPGAAAPERPRAPVGGRRP